MHLASHRSIIAASGLSIQKINWDGWFLDQAPARIVLVSCRVPLPTTYLFVAHATVIYPSPKVVTMMTLVIQSACCFSTSLLSFFKVFPTLFPPVFSFCPLGFFISCLKKYFLVMAVYFSTAHYVLNQSHHLSSRR